MSILQVGSLQRQVAFSFICAPNWKPFHLGSITFPKKKKKIWAALMMKYTSPVYWHSYHFEQKLTAAPSVPTQYLLWSRGIRVICWIFRFRSLIDEMKRTKLKSPLHWLIQINMSANKWSFHNSPGWQIYSRLTESSTFSSTCQHYHLHACICVRNIFYT